jgi:hypothetical protein
LIHPCDGAFLRYVADRPSDQERLAIDAHAADCPECRRRLQALLYARENLSALAASWTAAEHGRAYRQWRVAKALEDAAARSPSLAATAARWVDQLAAGVGMRLKVLVDRARRIASAAADVLPTGCDFELRPVLAGVCSAEELTRLDAHLKKAGARLAEDKPAEAIAELSEAVRIDARAPQAAVCEVRRQGAVLLQTIADGRHGRLSAKFWPSEGQAPPALAVLLSEDVARSAPVSRLEPVEGELYLVAEFEGLAGGIYALAIGPWPQEQGEPR